MSRSLFSEANERVVETLVAARHAAGLKQADVARKLNKNQSYISNIERGQRRIDVLEFYVLARALGADPVTLFASAVERLPETFDV